MANCKALIAAMLLCLSFVRSHGDAGSVAPSTPEREHEIQKLRTKVASLEDEINRKNEETLELESVVKERTAQVTALVAELDLLQKVNVADDDSVMKASTQNALLEEQIERLGSDLADQVKKGEALEAQAIEAEKTSREIGRKLAEVEKINFEQKKKIQELNKKLQQTQAKLSGLEKADESAKVHGMCLPHWLAVHIVRYQELASAKWQVHGKPVFGPLMQKVAEKLTHGQQLVEPHLQTAQNVAKSRINSLKNTMATYVSMVTTKTSTAYKVCRDHPYTVKARELAVHPWEESKKRTQPYIDRIVAACEPHLSKANVILEPHLSGDNRLTWFAASALFILPMLYIFRILSVAFWFWRMYCSYHSSAGGGFVVRRTRTAVNKGDRPLALPGRTRDDDEWTGRDESSSRG